MLQIIARLRIERTHVALGRPFLSFSKPHNVETRTT